MYQNYVVNRVASKYIRKLWSKEVALFQHSMKPVSFPMFAWKVNICVMVLVLMIMEVSIILGNSLNCRKLSNFNSIISLIG